MLKELLTIMWLHTSAPIHPDSEMCQYTCPVCGHIGGNSVNREPFCDKCEYRVLMKKSNNGKIIK